MKPMPRIVVVGDELPVRTVLGDCLERQGYCVLIACNVFRLIRSGRGGMIVAGAMLVCRTSGNTTGREMESGTARLGADKRMRGLARPKGPKKERRQVP